MNYSLVIESRITLILLVKDALQFVFLGVFVVCVCVVRRAAPGPGRLAALDCSYRPGPLHTAAAAQNRTQLSQDYDDSQRFACRALRLALFPKLFFAIGQNAQKAHN